MRAARIFWGCALRERTAAARHTPNNKRARLSNEKKIISVFQTATESGAEKLKTTTGSISLHWFSSDCTKIHVCVRTYPCIKHHKNARLSLSLWCSQSSGHAFCQSKERAAAVFYGFIVKIWFYNKYVEKYEYFLRQHSSGRQRWGKWSKE